MYITYIYIYTSWFDVAAKKGKVSHVFTSSVIGHNERIAADIPNPIKQHQSTQFLDTA